MSGGMSRGMSGKSAASLEQLPRIKAPWDLSCLLRKLGLVNVKA